MSDRIKLTNKFICILCVNIYLINNGIGPLITTYGNILGWLICCMSSYISVRDQFSYNILKKWKMDDKSSLSFDLAVLAEPSYTRRLSSDQILGISITPVFEIYHASPEKDLLLVEQVSKCANRWLETKTNSKIYLFIFHGESKDDDVSITRLLNSKLINPNRVETIKYNSNPENVLNKVNECSAFIGMKYHSCVFAYMCDVPLLLIEYHPKCRYFAEEVELPNEAIVSLEEVLSNSIEKRFENFISFPGRYIARLSLNEARNRAKRPFLEGIFYENISS